MAARSGTPVDRLRSRLSAVGAPLCGGIDPHPDAFPREIPRTAAGLERYATGLVEAVAPHVAAIKLNAAFFEAFGSAGWRALERVRRAVPPGIFTIIDAKRGDISSTAERYAESIAGGLAADAVTLSPYLGEDAIEPFIERGDVFVYVLARTSNPGAGTFQDRVIDGRPLYEHVAAWVASRWPPDRAGLVVGATAPDELRRLRSVVPEHAFLVPGVGAQGGDLATALETCHGGGAPGVVNVSRGMAAASAGRDWRQAAAAAAESWRRRLLEAGATLGV